MTAPAARDVLQAHSVDVAPRVLGARLTSSVGGVDVTVRLTEVGL